MAFGTLTYAKKLQEAGVPPQQAETHAWALKEQVEDTLATKLDLQLVRQDVQLVRSDVRELDTRIEGRFKEVDGRFTELETRIEGRFKEVDGRFTELETRMDGRFRLLYWMLGFNMALTLFTFSLTAGVLLKLLAG